MEYHNILIFSVSSVNNIKVSKNIYKVLKKMSVREDLKQEFSFYLTGVYRTHLLLKCCASFNVFPHEKQYCVLRALHTIQLS